MEKSKEELSRIATKAVETRRIKVQSIEMVSPLLQLMKDGKEYQLYDLEVPLSKIFFLTSEQLNETMENGKKYFFYRMGWAKHFLKISGLITILPLSKMKISSFGLNFLNKHPNFGRSELEEIPEWQEKYGKHKTKKEKNINFIHEPINKTKQELLEKLKEGSPYFFETLLVKLLEKMGYGIGIVTQKSHDGGIDGIVTADKLGLSEIYIQAKRYSGGVPISQIKEFIGTIQTTKTKTGVFITSGTLPESANEAILKSGLNIQLIDGEKLSDLMYDFDIGVKTKIVEPIKYIDEAFFVEEGLS